METPEIYHATFFRPQRKVCSVQCSLKNLTVYAGFAFRAGMRRYWTNAEYKLTRAQNDNVSKYVTLWLESLNIRCRLMIQLNSLHKACR